MKPHIRRIRLTFWLGLMITMFAVLLASCGCGRTRDSQTTADFESTDAESPLPSGWDLVVHAGTYKVASVQGGHSGRAAIAVAGAGGMADVLGPTMNLKPFESLQARIWLDTGAVADADATIGCVIGATGDPNNFTTLQRANGDVEGWLKYSATSCSAESGLDREVRFAVRLNGEGLLRIDNVQFEKVIIDPQYQLNETFDDEAVILKGQAFTISPGAVEFQVQRTTTSPASGSGALNVSGRNGWCSVISNQRVPVADHQLNASVMVRVKSGVGHLKIEYFRGDQHMDSTRAELAQLGGWRQLSTCSVAEFMTQADNVRVSVAAVNGDSQEGFDVDFDDLQLTVTKPVNSE